MTRIAVLTAFACVAMSAALLVLAWRRMGIARLALRAMGDDVRDASAGMRKLVGVLEPGGALLLAPFTERPVLYAHASLRGVGPEGGAMRVLWDKTLVTSARVCEKGASVSVDLTGARVLVPREHRQGTLRALVPELRVVPRALSRAGYSSAPPATQWFHVQEEVLTPGARVSVIGQYDGAGRIRGTPSQPLVVSTLTPWRIVLRVAWGPALAVLMAAIIAVTGASVIGAWIWLR